ncbi:hypothetical protein [Alteribacter populi]|uniref:hypothetical protein n=1 Tax=Alteribacter populi TaxID=2011011 RepID=UPI000BBAEDAA|nr:hypothetical protein [Alteribacter populi]
MNADLLPNEKRYVNEIIEILKSNGVKPTYRDDAKEQLVEYIHEARFNNEDFSKSLGTPESFALHFMDAATTKEEQIINTMHRNSKEAKHQKKKSFPIKRSIFFILVAGIFYLVLQLFTVLTFTPVLAPGYAFDFHLFVISDYLWWNLLITGINIGIALILSSITMYMLSKRYRMD